MQSSSSSHRCPTFLSHPGRVMMSAKLGRPAASRAFDACLSCSCASSCRYLRVCSARHAPVKSKTEKTAASQCHDCCKSMPFSTHVPHMLHTCPHQSPPALTPRSTYQPITPSEYEPSTESEHRASSQHVQDLLVRFILPRACFLLCWRRQKHATAGHGGGLGQGGDQGERYNSAPGCLSSGGGTGQDAAQSASSRILCAHGFCSVPLVPSLVPLSSLVPPGGTRTLPAAAAQHQSCGLAGRDRPRRLRQRHPRCRRFLPPPRPALVSCLLVYDGAWWPACMVVLGDRALPLCSGLCVRALCLRTVS